MTWLLVGIVILAVVVLVHVLVGIHRLHREQKITDAMLRHPAGKDLDNGR